MEPAAGRRRLAAELNRAIIQTERRTGRSVDRPELSKRINVSVTSLYAYLNGTTLPHSRVFDALLDALEVPGREAGRLSTLRDAIEVAQRARRQRRKDLDHPAGAVPPRQLPPPHAHFVGRTHELGLLDELRTTGRPPTQGGADPPRTAAVIV
ncbi:MAG TPA: helix-turn-helix domain-containing protein, partial [Streptomyces sp.]